MASPTNSEEQKPVPPLDAEQVARLQEEVNELAKTTRRQLYVLIFTGFYLVLALAGPDAQLVRADASISWPLIKAEVPLSAFLTYAPVALVALLIYLHLFVGRLTYLRRQEIRAPQIFIFAMSDTPARLVADLLFYAFVPLILTYFTWKTLFREEAEVLVVTTIAVSVACVTLHYVRAINGHSAVRRLAGLVVLGLLALSIMAGSLTLILFGREPFLKWRNVDLVRADLSVSAESPYVDLAGVDLRYADLRLASLVGADLRYANLAHADLTGATLGQAADNAEDGVALGADLDGATLTSAKLASAGLGGVNFSGAKLRGADLRQARLDKTNFSCADLSNADLVRTEGEGTNFSDADLEGADLGFANLYKANFSKTNLKSATLMSAKLEEATFGGGDLSHTNLEEANIEGAYFAGTTLFGAKFRFVRGWDNKHFSGARYCKTVLPDEITRNDHCADVLPQFDRKCR